ACWLTSDGAKIVTANQYPAGFKGVRIVNRVTGEAKEVGLLDYRWLQDIDCSPRAGLILAVTGFPGPVGSTIASERSQIGVFKPDGTEQRKLIDEDDKIYSARWSPRGDSIYFLHAKGSIGEFSRIPIEGKAGPLVIASGLGTGNFFTLSADGSRLAYTRE